MSETIYHQLARVLDTLPNGFPSTKTGLEIEILKMVFTPEEAEIFCDLTLTAETAEEIALRSGRSPDQLEEKLIEMEKRGEINCSRVDGRLTFRMLPWVVGIYERQLSRMTQGFARLCEDYNLVLGPQLLMNKPQLMRVLPVEIDIPVHQEALPYDQVSHILEGSQSFGVKDCVCNKAKHMIGEGCSKPKEVCMSISSAPDAFKDDPSTRKISRQEALSILQKAEDAALVHLTANTQENQTYICNCCSCCCPILGSVKMYNSSVTVNSSYIAEIDAERCDTCGVCKDERCQVEAIISGSASYQILEQKCIGCGLCIGTCPNEAIRMIEKQDTRQFPTPINEDDWLRQRGETRGVDYGDYLPSQS